MTEEQAAEIIELLKDIKNRLFAVDAMATIFVVTYFLIVLAAIIDYIGYVK